MKYEDQRGSKRVTDFFKSDCQENPIRESKTEINKMEMEEINKKEMNEFDSMADLSPQFIKSPKVGEKVEFVVKGFKKVTNKEELDFYYEVNGKQKKASNCLSSVDYGIKLTTQENKVFWVNSWSVFGQIKSISRITSNDTLSGLKLQIDHQLDGKLEENRDKACWIVRYDKNGQWKDVLNE